MSLDHKPKPKLEAISKRAKLLRRRFTDMTKGLVKEPLAPIFYALIIAYLLTNALIPLVLYMVFFFLDRWEVAKLLKRKNSEVTVIKDEGKK